MDILFILFQATTLLISFRIAVPLIFASIGGAFSEKANVFNIALESFLLIGAFFSVLGSYLYSSPFIGLFFGIGASLIMSVLFAIFVIILKCQPIIVGIAFNLSTWGITTLLMESIFKVRGSFSDSRIRSFPAGTLAFLDNIPYLGMVFGEQNILFWIAIIFIIGAHYLMFYTPTGLRLRAVGLKSEAAQTLGVDPRRYQWFGILMSGVGCGLGGSALTLSGLSLFSENMSAGKGFLALAAILVGKGNPLKVALIAFLFAYLEAVSIELQRFNISSYIVLMIPYLVTIAVLVAFSRKKHSF